MVDVVNKFIAEHDAAKRVDLMKQYQKLYTENVYDGRSHPVSGCADHQQALRQHPGGRPDLHVQLG